MGKNPVVSFPGNIGDVRKLSILPEGMQRVVVRLEYEPGLVTPWSGVLAPCFTVQQPGDFTPLSTEAIPAYVVYPVENHMDPAGKTWSSWLSTGLPSGC